MIYLIQITFIYNGVINIIKAARLTGITIKDILVLLIKITAVADGIITVTKIPLKLTLKQSLE